jgi:hypothetical protein
MPVWISQDCGDDSRDVRSCNRRNPAVTGRPADHAVLAGQASKEVDVEVVPYERESHTRGLDVLLGEIVIARQSEHCVGAAPMNEV